MQVETITGKHIRAARGALNWSVQKLSDESGVGAATIKRYEAQKGVPRSFKGNLEKLKIALERSGIEFIVSRDGRPGILIDTKKRLPEAF